MKKLLKNTVAGTVILCLLIVISSLNASIRPFGRTSIIFPPDTVVTGDTNTPADKEGGLPYPFADENLYSEPGSSTESGLYLKKPSNINSEVIYNPETNEYEFTEKIGEIDYRKPQSMSFEDYREYDFDKAMQDYWQQRVRSENFSSQKSLLPVLHIGGEVFDRIFGSNTIDIRPQGSAELIFGLQISRVDNPMLSEKLRKTTTFDFQEKIQMNVTGQIGDKLKLATNYNTEASFDFENKMNLAYEGKEDEIIQKVEAGDVTLPLTGTLITGSQSLFGIKTELQFGKLTATSVFSQQKGKTSVIEVEGGAQTNTFEVYADDYEANKHFFLGQYFYQNFNNAMSTLPIPSTGIIITKIEVWVTNKSGQYNESRNILALMDLGETGSNIYATGYVQSNQTTPYPKDDNNSLVELVTTYPAIRNINDVSNQLAPLVEPQNFRGGQDYEKIESARMLTESEYKINNELGFISLNSSLNSDEVLAVAYEYNYQGETFKVGELSIDGIAAPNTLIVKLLKGTSLTPRLPTWRLMMKNIYAIGAYQVSSEDFRLDILYNDPRTGTPTNYIPVDPIRNKTLLELFNLDNLNSQLDHFSDGMFDFIEGMTIISSNGRIIFPVLEPFGENLETAFDGAVIAKQYVYNELYDSTQTVARQAAEKNKFIIKGEYKSAGGSDISLNALNIPQGSVVVTAGGRKLTENVDYTVDYNLGRVKILNTGLLESGTPIKISLESNSLFSIQSKTLMGTHLDYRVSKDFSLGGTVMRLTERPMTQKVNIGDEPIKNTIWGLDGTYRTESPFLTKLIDKLPFLETKETSSITVTGEFAHLIPGHSRAIEKEGVSYIDDFEGSKTSLDIKSPSAWFLASTPQGQPTLFPGGDAINNLSYGFYRSKLAWYNIDQLFQRDENNISPDHLTDDDRSNHFVREIYETEIYKLKQSESTIPTRIGVMNLAYYPTERGAYNYDTVNINSDGSLTYPEKHWGGIMRRLETNDFETANIEFIEFWMMDPFWNNQNHKGGEMYFNLGDISEDVLKDGRKTFENGLPSTSLVENVDTSLWGRIPLRQSIVNAFDNDEESRLYQDVGLDGLNTAEEQDFFSTEQHYLEALKSKFTEGSSSGAYTKAFADPSSDDFHYYRGGDFDGQHLGILDRYKRYNGVEGNSPTTSMSPEEYPTQATNTPDGEDINRDNNLSESENYFQYKFSIFPGMDIGDGYIVDKVSNDVTLPNGTVDKVTWYQFQIPIEKPDSIIGSIQDFKSIRFVRMLLGGFQEEVIVRLAKLDLVRGEWRKYKGVILEPGETMNNDNEAGQFDISAVNIEENADKQPVNYLLPPDISRVIDPGNPQLRQLNEQAISLKVRDLEDGDAKAAYKNVNIDVRQYKRLKMDVHCEALVDGVLNANDLTAFIRLGSDYKQNYYEYETPLAPTPAGHYSDTEEGRDAVWPSSNRIDFLFEVLQTAKQARNDEMRMAGSTVSYATPYYYSDGENKVTIMGNPNLSNIRTIMLGIRNPVNKANPDGLAQSGEVWMNELRLTDFDEKGGWAANARINTRLADFGTLNLSGSTARKGFGSIEKKVNERNKEDNYLYDISSNLELGKFFPEKANVTIPMYVGYSESFSNPQYNPLDKDIPIEVALDAAETRRERDSIKKASQDYVKRKSLNFTNVKLKSDGEKLYPWSAPNFSLNYGFNALNSRSINIEENNERNSTGGLMYNYNATPVDLTPFKNAKSKFMKSPWMKLVKDFSINFLPSQISWKANMTRQYKEVKYRDLNNVTNDPYYIANKMRYNVNKDFNMLWGGDLKYNPTRALKIDFAANTGSRIDEPVPTMENEYGRVLRDDEENYQYWKDSVWKNINQFGRRTIYHQALNANYTIPINKIPLFSWITASARYSATMDWMAGPQMQSGSNIHLGNTLKNSNRSQLNGQLNFLSLYNKVDYLKKINQKYKGGPKAKQPKKTEKVQFPLKGDPKKTVNLKADMPRTITHNLETDDIEVKLYDSTGAPIKGDMIIKSDNKITFTAKQDYEDATVEIYGNREIKDSWLKISIEQSLRVLMGVKNLNISYSTTQGSNLPGYAPETDMFGWDFSEGSPGMPFWLGKADKDFPAQDEYSMLVPEPRLNSLYTTSFTKNLNVRSSIEPFTGMRIDVTADRTETKNNSEKFSFYDKDSTAAHTDEPIVKYDERYNNIEGFWKRENLRETGSFSMSFNTWNSAFRDMDKDNDYSSKAFKEFSDNRKIISERLTIRRSDMRNAASPDYPVGWDPNQLDSAGYYNGYGATSKDVIIPAFIAAYTGQDASDVSLDAIPDVFDRSGGKFRMNLMPNWRVTYDGLKNIRVIKKYVKTITISHAYRSSYSIGSFGSNTSYQELEYDELSYELDKIGNYYPKYDINSITISEQFSPLINVDVTWNNSLITKFEYKKTRNLSFSFSNYWLSETTGEDYVIGAGYRIKSVKLKVNEKQFDSDINLRADFSHRKNLTIMRKLTEDMDEITAGQTNYSIKVSADYVLSDRFNLKLFFERVASDPKISRSYKTANTNFGISIMFTLTQ